MAYADVGEFLVAARVSIFDASGDGQTPVATVVTAQDGTYLFAGMAPGAYRVRVSPEPEFLTQWYPEKDSFAAAGNVVVDAGGQVTNISFHVGESGVTHRSIYGHVYDGMMVYDHEDGPAVSALAGATVEVFDAAGDGTTPFAVVKTDAYGQYYVNNLGTRTIRVKASAPGRVSLWNSNRLSFDTVSDTDRWSGDFHLYDSANGIAGVVYGAPARVELFDAASATSPPVATTNTVNAAFEFRDIAPGRYTMHIVNGTNPTDDEWYTGKRTRETANVLVIEATTHYREMEFMINRPIAGPKPTISGTVSACTTLTAESPSWFPAPVTLSYQWIVGGAAVTGATERTFAVPADSVGKTVAVRVTGSKSGFDSLSQTSNATAPVIACMLGSSKPVITGPAHIGSTVTADAGAWSPYPLTLAYRWLRNGTVVPGATEETYVLAAEDAGNSVTVEVTGSRPGYADVLRTSDPFAVDRRLDATPTPTIAGIARYGSTLTASPGVWGPIPVTVAYQWLRNGTAIPGATSAGYVIAAGDIGARISVRVKGSKSGYTPETRLSVQTSAVGPRLFTTAPTPRITGTVRVAATLAATVGAWAPAPTTLTYQWYRNGTAISGATGAVLKLGAADVGKRMTVRVTAARTGFATTARMSTQTTPVAQGRLTATPTPTITGTTRVGRVLTVHAGTWKPAPVGLSYTWRRNGVAIAGATGTATTTYTLVKADVGATITCTVVSTKTGYVSVTKTTAKTAVVRP
ncbi:MSCRAMM family protein [Leifsonia sp. Leaf264]|uniref:MSCRAMM family protein n=1 Tax=Leifsonia sp. Leaf264 TaxID=1736314 RepID=UPI0012F9C635|nr:hypothetical protein [Leifsonia sp. Leaf264]